MRKTNTTAVCGEVYVLLSVLPEKQRLSLANNFNSLSVCDENKSPRSSALRAETTGYFSPENSLRPHD